MPAAVEERAAAGAPEGAELVADAVFPCDGGEEGGAMVEEVAEAEEGVVEITEPCEGEECGAADGEDAGEDGGAGEFGGDEEGGAGGGVAVGGEPDGEEIDGEEDETGEEEGGEGSPWWEGSEDLFDAAEDGEPGEPGHGCGEVQPEPFFPQEDEPCDGEHRGR